MGTPSKMLTSGAIICEILEMIICEILEMIICEILEMIVCVMINYGMCMIIPLVKHAIIKWRVRFCNCS